MSSQRSSDIPIVESIKKTWGVLQKLLDKGFDALLEKEAAPESSLNPFRDTKSKLQKEINAILDKSVDILDVSDLSDVRAKIQRLEKEKKQVEAEISGLQMEKLSTTNTSKMIFWKNTEAGIDKKIAAKKDKIKSLDHSMAQLKEQIQRGLPDKGICLDGQQIDCLLFSITCDNEIQIISAYNNIKAITVYLRGLMVGDGSMASAKRYYGMTAVLLGVLHRLQDKYIHEASNVFVPKLVHILESNNQLINETSSQLNNATADLKQLYATNLKSQKATAEAGATYKKMLEDNIVRMEKSRDRTERQILFTINSYKTVESAANLIMLMNESENAFNALNELEVPDLVAFDTEGLVEFQSLTARLQGITS